MFGIKLILVILIISGVIAFVGDYLGRFIGRRRLTLFRLRPRYTAALITVISGILIAGATSLILISSSQDVRTALFGLSNLKRELVQKKIEITRIQEDLRVASAEVKRLSDLKSHLLKEVDLARSGLVIFRVGDVVISAVLEAGLDSEVIQNSLQEMLAVGNRVAERLNISSDKPWLLIPQTELRQAVNYLSGKSGEFIVRLVAAQNVMYGEKIPVHFEMFKNELVFRGGEIILSGIIDGRKSQSEIEKDIRELFTRVNLKAQESGILPDKEGSIGSVPYSEIFKIAKNIAKKHSLVTLEISSASDVYTLGPLNVSLTIK